MKRTVLGMIGLAVSVLCSTANASTAEALCQSESGRQHYMKVIGNGQTIVLDMVGYTFVKTGKADSANVYLYANGEKRQVMALMEAPKVRYYMVRDEAGKTIDSGMCEKTARY